MNNKTPVYHLFNKQIINGLLLLLHSNLSAMFSSGMFSHFKKNISLVLSIGSKINLQFIFLFLPCSLSPVGLSLTSGQIRNCTFIFFTFLSSLTCPLVAQVDTTIALSSFEVVDTRMNTKTTVQSNTVDLSLHQLLDRKTSIQFKVNSPNGLASIAARGTTAAQTTVSWNGINIQNSMNGVMDFNLLNVQNCLGTIELDYENGSLNAGNGGIGATITIDNSISNIDKTNTLQLQLGSFEQYTLGFQIVDTHQKSWYYISGFTNQTQNNYPYINTTKIGQPEEEQINAKASIYNLDAGIGTTFKTKHQFDLNYALQYGNRQIPPNMLAANVNAAQVDRTHKLLFNYSYQHNIGLKLAYLEDYILYTQDGLYAPSLSNTYLSQFQWKKAWSHFKFNLSSEYRLIQANADGYNKNHERAQVENSAQINYNARQLSFSFGLSQNFYTAFSAPVIGGLKIDYHFNTQNAIRFHLSKNFRIPSLNDLYWSQGGNPSLRPEESWNPSLSYSYSYKKSKTNLTIYSIFINDMIVWSPNSSGFWTPDNIQKVWSKGLEFDFENQWIFSNLKFNHRHLYALTLSSTYEDQLEWNGDQLPYTAIHQLKNNFDLAYETWTLNYNHRFYSKRFSNDGQVLPFYHLADLELEKSIFISKRHLLLKFSIHNIYNQTYQNLQHYPMPGRNYNFQIIFK